MKREQHIFEKPGKIPHFSCLMQRCCHKLGLKHLSDLYRPITPSCAGQMPWALLQEEGRKYTILCQVCPKPYENCNPLHADVCWLPYTHSSLHQQVMCPISRSHFDFSCKQKQTWEEPKAFHLVNPEQNTALAQPGDLGFAEQDSMQSPRWNTPSTTSRPL